jgi:hypothetical protein
VLGLAYKADTKFCQKGVNSHNGRYQYSYFIAMAIHPVPVTSILLLKKDLQPRVKVCEQPPSLIRPSPRAI